MAVILVLAMSATAQTKVTRDQQGNYVSVSAPKTEPKNTGKVYTDSKGVKYPVYESARGKLYIVRTSKKTGKKYNQYLTVE